MIDRPEPWTLPVLDAYVEGVLRRMGENRNVMTDERGEPYYVVLAAGRQRDGTLRIELEADCSAIGMPTNTPLAVIAPAASGPLAWFLGDQLLGSTGRQLTPGQAADAALNMDKLLDSYRRWINRNASEGRSR